MHTTSFARCSLTGCSRWTPHLHSMHVYGEGRCLSLNCQLEMVPYKSLVSDNGTATDPPITSCTNHVYGYWSICCLLPLNQLTYNYGAINWSFMLNTIPGSPTPTLPGLLLLLLPRSCVHKRNDDDDVVGCGYLMGWWLVGKTNCFPHGYRQQWRWPRQRTRSDLIVR